MQKVRFHQVYLSLLGTESKHGCLLRTLRFIKFFLLFSPAFKLHDYLLRTYSVPLCGVPGINQRKTTMLALKEILRQTGFMVPCSMHCLCVSPPSSSVETLIPNVQVLVGGASGRSLGQGREGEAPVMGSMPL